MSENLKIRDLEVSMLTIIPEIEVLVKDGTATEYLNLSEIKELRGFLTGVINKMQPSKFDWKLIYSKDFGNSSSLDFKNNARMGHSAGGYSGCFDRDGTRISSIVVYETIEEFENWLTKEMEKYDA